MDDHDGELSEEASASLTDGTDYKRRLMISTYFHLSRALQDADLREAERHATSEDMDPGGMFLWLVQAQSTVDVRHLLAGEARRTFDRNLDCGTNPRGPVPPTQGLQMEGRSRKGRPF